MGCIVRATNGFAGMTGIAGVAGRTLHTDMGWGRGTIFQNAGSDTMCSPIRPADILSSAARTSRVAAGASDTLPANFDRTTRSYRLDHAMGRIVGTTYDGANCARVTRVAGDPFDTRGWRLGRAVGQHVAHHAVCRVIRAANNGPLGAGIARVAGDVRNAHMRITVVTGGYE